jgi:serine/threonine-protein kinase
MLHSDSAEVDLKSPPFDQLKSLQRLSTARRGQGPVESARHHLYVGRDRRSRASVLVKLTSRPGLVYQSNLANEIASLSTINHALPDSPYFPVVRDHGSLPDGRVYLIASLFDERPLATTIGMEPLPARLVAHLRTVLEVAKALADLHHLKIFHVDLNPMNILHRVEKGRPVIRIVDFESSYELARHSAGVFYSPPTTPGYSAPEVSRQAPDARADIFSLGAVLYTLLAGFGWTWGGEVGASVGADRDLDPDLKSILLSAVDQDPARRYPSIEAFRAALAAYLEHIWPGRSW